MTERTEARNSSQTRARSPLVPAVALLLRVGVGILLLIAGVGKLIDSSAAIASTESAIGVSGTLATIISVGISVLEIVLGVHLVIGLNLRWTAAAAAVLCAAFLLIVIKLWVSGYTGGCGCFGIFGGGTAGPEETLRDSLLVIAAAGAWLLRNEGLSLDHILRRNAG